jgi:hypothetical protein
MCETMTMRANRHEMAEALQENFGAILVAESSSGNTQVWLPESGARIEVIYLESGNAQVTGISEIPENLTVRY